MSEAAQRAKAQAWLGSYTKASRWMARWDLPALLEQHGGLVKVPGFFPEHVAEEALRILQGIGEQEWLPTEAADDAAANNIHHSFKSTKRGPGLEALLRVFTLLLPDQLHALSAARYLRSDGIAPHDDRAYTPVQLDTGKVISCSRDIAVIWYGCREWSPHMGGVLRDLQTGEREKQNQNRPMMLQKRAQTPPPPAEYKGQSQNMAQRCTASVPLQARSMSQSGTPS